MKQLFFLLTTLMLSVVSLSASNDYKSDVSGNHDRSAYSVIVVDNNREYSRGVKAWVDNYKPMSYLDYNDIQTKIIPYKVFANELSNYRYDHNKIPNWLTESKVGQEIVSAMFNRKEDGQIDDSVIKARGLYNARNVDEQIANATMLGSDVVLQDSGYDLIDKTYVLVLTMTGYDKSYGDKGVTRLFSGIDAYLYRLDLNQDLVNDVIFNSARVLPTDSDDVKDAKNKIFNDIEFQFTEVLSKLITYQHVSFVSGDKQEKYIPELYDLLHQEVQNKMERRIETFNAQIPIESTKPIKAKIGSKESLRNNARYNAYKFVLKNDKIKPVRTATVVATTIANNTIDNTKESEFLQIAGYGIEEGYVLKHRSNRISQFSPYYRMGALGGYGFNMVFKTATTTKGGSGFGGVYFNRMSYNITDLNDGKQQYILDNPMLYDEGDWTAFSVGFRVGKTKRFLRFFEAGMHLNFGLDGINASYTEELEDDPDVDDFGAAFTGTLGANLRVNLIYPVHLILGVDYSVGAIGDDSKDIYNVLKDVGANRLGLGYSIGLSFSL